MNLAACERAVVIAWGELLPFLCKKSYSTGATFSEQNNLTIQGNKKLLYTVPADRTVSVNNERPGALQLLRVILPGDGLVSVFFCVQFRSFEGFPGFFF